MNQSSRQQNKSLQKTKALKRKHPFFCHLHFAMTGAGLATTFSILTLSFTLSFFFSLLALTPNIALAQTTCTGTQTTISADQTTVEDVSTDNDCLAIGAGARLDIATGTDSAVTLSGEGTSLSNEGAISVTSAGDASSNLYPSAVLASGDNAIITNSRTGRIFTTQNNVSAVRVGSSTGSVSDVTVTNSGLVETEGDEAHGIYSLSTSSGVEINHLAGVIETEGNQAHGIYVLGGGNGVATVRSSVSATGANAYAINLANENQLIVRLGSSDAIQGGIKVAGAGVDDMDDNDAANDEARAHSIVIGEGASLATDQDDRYGIEMGGANGVIDVQGSLTTTGDNAVGIASSGTAVEIGLSGVITTSGMAAHGIFVSGGGNGVVTVAGSINAMGDNAYAINLARENQLDLELSAGQTITGSILLDGAGIDDNDTPSDDTDDTERAHFIIVGEAATITGGIEGSDVFSAIPTIRTSWVINIGIEGSVSSIANNAAAIYVNGFDVAGSEIINSGTISTIGEGQAHGIFSDTSASRVEINHLDGTISTKGDGAYGIYLQGGGNGSVMVRSSVLAMGADAYAINLADTNQLDLEIGSGESIIGGIKVAGAGVDLDDVIDDGGSPDDDRDDTYRARAHSIVIGQGASLATESDNIYGIFSSGADTVVNVQGSLATTGKGAHGIYLTGDSPQITITGNITTADIGGYGIYTTGINSHITISGHIKTTGENAYAIKAENGVTLTLMSSAVIEGQIDLGIAGQDATTGEPRVNQVIVRLSDIPHTSKIFRIMNAGEITIKGEGALVLKTRDNDTDVISLIDPTGAAMMRANVGGAIAHMNKALHQRLAQKLNPEPKGARSWGHLFASEGEYEADGLMLSFDTNFYGGFGGYEAIGENGGRFGVFLGVANGEVETNRQSVEAETDNLFLGVYKSYIGQTGWRGWSFDGSLVAGHHKEDAKRYIVGVKEPAKANLEIWTMTATLGGNMVHELGTDSEVRSRAELSYSLAHFDGYEERGAQGFNLHYGKQETNILNARLNIGVVKVFGVKRGKGANAKHIGIGELEFYTGIDMRSYESDDGEVQFVGGNEAVSYVVPGDDGFQGQYVGARLNYAVRQQVSFVGNVEYGASYDDEFVTGHIGFEIRF